MSKNVAEFSDPFAQARVATDQKYVDDQGEDIALVLGHRDVRKCAHDHRRFQSGAEPGRIVIPSEENIRDLRQIPFEVDPPMHKDYRNLLEDWFRRPQQEGYQEKINELLKSSLSAVLACEQVELVHEFSLPLQSRALTFLLNLPMSEAKTWISWGTHVFRSDDNPLDDDKANHLVKYLQAQIEKFEANPGEDIYSVLLSLDFQGRKLTHEEIQGIMMLTFAGGRDTVINAVTNSLAYLAAHPEAIGQLRSEPDMINSAVEELVRYFAPLTQMGRVATQDTEVCGHAVAQNARISLCWASANRDEKVFENPHEVKLDRKINPHLSFGFGVHKCLGAHHARAILRGMLHVLPQMVEQIEIIDYEEKIEPWKGFERKVGYEKMTVRFQPKS